MLKQILRDPFWRTIFAIACIGIAVFMIDYLISTAVVSHDFVDYRNTGNSTWLRAEAYRAVVNPEAPVQGETILRSVNGAVWRVYQDPTGQAWAIINTGQPTSLISGNEVVKGQPLMAAVQLTSLWEFPFPDNMTVWIDDATGRRTGHFQNGQIILDNQ